jgi:hypothetical protein
LLCSPFQLTDDSRLPGSSSQVIVVEEHAGVTVPNQHEVPLVHHLRIRTTKSTTFNHMRMISAMISSKRTSCCNSTTDDGVRKVPDIFDHCAALHCAHHPVVDGLLVGCPATVMWVFAVTHASIILVHAKSLPVSERVCLGKPHGTF